MTHNNLCGAVAILSEHLFFQFVALVRSDGFQDFIVQRILEGQDDLAQLNISQPIFGGAGVLHKA